jgi:hypothetical protein
MQMLVGCILLLVLLTVWVNRRQIVSGISDHAKSNEAGQQADKSVVVALRDDKSSNRNGNQVESFARTAQLPNGSTGSASSALTGLNDSSFAALMNSQNSVLVEYALNRAHINCSSFMTASTAIENVTSPANPFANGLPMPAPINSTKELRERAALDMHKKCIAYMGDFVLDDAARKQAYNRFPELQAIIKARIDAKDRYGVYAYGEASNPALMDKVLQGPYFGLLALSKYWFEENELPTIAGKEFNPAFTELAVDYLLMCRLGEDCSPGSFTSNRMCALTGLCGGYVEDTLIKYFQGAGLNWSLFDSYVRRIQLATTSGDISVFRKKPT